MLKGVNRQVSHRIAGDFNAPTVCGIPKEHWKNATSEWDWTNCPTCLEQRENYTLVTDMELREKILSITGHTSEINEVLDEMESMKTAISELFDENQALGILNRKLRLCLTLAESSMSALQTDAAMFVTEKTRSKMNQFFDQINKTNAVVLSKLIQDDKVEA